MGIPARNRNRIVGWFFVLLLTSQAATATAQDEPNVPQPTRPAVLAVLETNPSTPAQWVEAAQVLTQLGRPDLGKQFLGRLIKAKPNDQQLVALADRFGSPLFVDLASREALLPEAETVADMVLGAANRANQDPKRLAQQIAQLSDPAASVRERAMAGLKDAGRAAVLALIDTLGDEKKAELHPYARAALVEMGTDAIGPLLGTLDATNPQLAAQAIRILARMDVRRATVYFLEPFASEDAAPEVQDAAAAALKHMLEGVPGKEQAVELLVERAKQYFYGGEAIRPETDGLIKVWRWDAKKRQPVAQRYTPEDAARVRGARLARAAYALDPEDPELKRLYLITLLEEAAYEKGLDEPLEPGKDPAVDRAEALGAAALEDVLHHAMDTGHIPAATAVARILGRIGSVEQIHSRSARFAPLVSATCHPDRRLRLAAAEAIVKLEPKRPFAGSSYVVPALAFFAGTSGSPRAIVAGPSMEKVRELVGELARQGFEVSAATTGGEMIEMATSSPDYELALVDPTIGDPTAYLLLQRLRRDELSADLRVGLIARHGHLARARQLAARDPLVLAFSRPHDDQSVAWQIDQLAKLRPRAFVPREERQKQAETALDLLVEIAHREDSPLDLKVAEPALLTALYVPSLSVRAAEVLSTLNSARSQKALVNMASRWTLPLKTRKAAAAAFAESVRRHDLLLTSDEILLQYDRYNQSETLDRPTQVLLGMILDVIEPPKVQQIEEPAGGDVKVDAPEVE